jgi:hypothetical protein
LIRENILANSYNIIGKLYWHGESGPDFFDCSGLIHYVYNFSGVPIQRKTVNEYYYDNNYINIKSQDLKIGDLVFYGSNEIANNLGIYVGNNQIVIVINGTEKTKGNDSIAKVSLKSINFKTNILGYKRHLVLSSLDDIHNDTYLDTSKYKGKESFLEPNTTVNVEQSISFTIYTYVYNTITDKEERIDSYFEKIMNFGSEGKCSWNILKKDKQTIDNNIQKYKENNNIKEDIYIDILEYEVEVHTSNVYAKIKENESNKSYKLGEYIYFYSNVPTIILPKLILNVELIDTTAILNWRFKDNKNHGCTFVGYLNEKKAFETTNKNEYIFHNLNKGSIYSFKVIAKHSLDESSISNIITKETIAAEEELPLFKNTLIIDQEKDPIDDEAIITIEGKIDNEEYKQTEATLTVLSSLQLEKPIYPNNSFECELQGEYEKGTEFYYDIWVDIKTLEDTVIRIKKEMEYLNINSNGSYNEPLNITNKSVTEILKEDIIKELKRLNIDYKDKLTPQFNLKYNFKNTIPLELDLLLYKSGSYKEILPTKTNTEIIMDIEIINNSNENLGSFINSINKYCPNKNISSIEKIEIVKNNERKLVKWGE